MYVCIYIYIHVYIHMCMYMYSISLFIYLLSLSLYLLLFIFDLQSDALPTELSRLVIVVIFISCTCWHVLTDSLVYSSGTISNNCANNTNYT